LTEGDVGDMMMLSNPQRTDMPRVKAPSDRTRLRPDVLIAAGKLSYNNVKIREIGKGILKVAYRWVSLIYAKMHC
jgi:hypothetical protein